MEISNRGLIIDVGIKNSEYYLGLSFLQLSEGCNYTVGVSDIHV